MLARAPDELARLTREFSLSAEARPFYPAEVLLSKKMINIIIQSRLHWGSKREPGRVKAAAAEGLPLFASLLATRHRLPVSERREY